MLSVCHDFPDQDVGWNGHENRKLWGICRVHKSATASGRQNWSTRSTLTLLFPSPSVKIMPAQTCRPGHPGKGCLVTTFTVAARLSESLYHLTCLGGEFKTTLMAPWDLEKLPTGVSVTPISSATQPRPSEASHFTLFWCSINHGGRLWQRPVGDPGRLRGSHTGFWRQACARCHIRIPPLLPHTRTLDELPGRGVMTFFPKVYNSNKSQKIRIYFWKLTSSVLIFVTIIPYGGTNLNDYMSDCVLW